VREAKHSSSEQAAQCTLAAAEHKAAALSTLSAAAAAVRKQAHVVFVIHYERSNWATCVHCCSMICAAAVAV
jgi:hypothetical protein